MTPNDIQGQLQRFVGNALGADISPDDNIFEAGATSLFAIELVMFIETTFGVELDDSDLEAANFESVGAMARLTQRKMA